MIAKIRVTDLPAFDSAEYLKDDTDITAYLSVVIEKGNVGELARALSVTARARGMAQIAQETGIGREAL